MLQHNDTLTASLDALQNTFVSFSNLNFLPLNNV
jgi:hypothetical protein